VYFNDTFCKLYVREVLLVGYLKYIASVAKEYSDGSHDPVPYQVVLILSRICLEFESVAIDYLVFYFLFVFCFNDYYMINIQGKFVDNINR
jgi:hypothetical protein